MITTLASSSRFATLNFRPVQAGVTGEFVLRNDFSERSPTSWLMLLVSMSMNPHARQASLLWHRSQQVGRTLKSVREHLV